ncbi:3-oxoadipate enol-lactonase [Actinomycetospora endophytica]|uniref:3-oxoadipate enol-lactonase n=1 Tax=Actinomycetospora endophytica TaxID=2291215 RepID=A0ABS8P6G4_9PSEU|nr:3-oxoadipate enol-lactonase [Actinomycetospora endophytica]MCD2193833.1 3-oxoadipate enol-lactonase [Actinomycetospora endophytica]
MRLHLTDEGPRDSGTPLVLLCSLGSTVDMWAPQREELARERRVVTMDTRGHGGSPVPAGPYTVAELADDVVETLDDLGIGRAAFAGLSLGGAMSQAIALRAPDRVVSLALLCTAARFGNLATFSDRAVKARAEGVEAIAAGVVTRWFTADADEDMVARMQAMIAATPPEGYASCCEAIVGWDSRADLGRISAPTLVISGAEDPATPPADGEVLADGIPGARLEVVPDAAHLASYQRPDVVTGLLAEHLKASS